MINNSMDEPFGRGRPTDDVPLPLCTVDEKGRFHNCNRMFSTLIGQPSEALLRRSIFELADSSLENFFRTSLVSLPPSAPIAMRAWIYRADGSMFPAILSLVVTRRESSLLFANIAVIDDTYNYSAREAAKQESEESRRKEILKNEFIAVASHELRTPIQPILGFALLAKKGKVSQEQAWDGVLKEARRLQQLANDILDVSRIESKTIIYRIEPVRLNELLKTVVESHQNDLKKDLAIKLNADTEIEIEADRSRLTQVVSNLLGNAIKFTPSGVVEISAKVITEESVVEISVTDTGPGIPREVLPRLFTKFATKSHGDAVTSDGTGLGLFICKAIVEGHRGSIRGRNNEGGVGATFTIRLPLKQSS